MTTFTLTAYGSPVTQGSKTATRYGGMRDANSKTLHPWRERVYRAALDALGDPLPAPMQGPLIAHLFFVFPLPASAPKRRRTWPLGAKGDIDKLIRAVFDSLTDAGVWIDDSHVVEVSAGKDYVGAPDCPLDRPGVQVDVWTYDGAT